MKGKDAAERRRRREERKGKRSVSRWCESGGLGFLILVKKMNEVEMFLGKELRCETVSPLP